MVTQIAIKIKLIIPRSVTSSKKSTKFIFNFSNYLAADSLR